MTQLLEKVVEELRKLPPAEQDAVAAVLLRELATERRWSELFAGSQDNLARMAEDALAEYRAGKAKPRELGGQSRPSVVTVQESA